MVQNCKILWLKESRASPHFSVLRREAAQTGMDARRAMKGHAGILDSMSRSPRKRNAADMPASAAAVEGW